MHNQLITACQHGDVTKVTSLIGLIENSILIKENNLAFITACKHNQLEVVKLLLTKDIIKENATALNNTALNYAVKNFYHEIIKILLEIDAVLELCQNDLFQNELRQFREHFYWAVKECNSQYVARLLLINRIGTDMWFLCRCVMVMAYNLRRLETVNLLMQIPSVLNEILRPIYSYYFDSRFFYLDNIELNWRTMSYFSRTYQSEKIYNLLCVASINSYFPLIKTILSIDNFDINYELMIKVLKNKTGAINNFNTYLSVCLVQNKVFLKNNHAQFNNKLWHALMVNLIKVYIGLDNSMPDDLLEIVNEDLINLINDYRIDWTSQQACLHLELQNSKFKNTLILLKSLYIPGEADKLCSLKPNLTLSNSNIDIFATPQLKFQIKKVLNSVKFKHRDTFAKIFGYVYDCQPVCLFGYTLYHRYAQLVPTNINYPPAILNLRNS